MLFCYILSFSPLPKGKEEKGKEGKGGRNEKREKVKGKGKKRQKKLKTFPTLVSWKCARNNVANVIHWCSKKSTLGASTPILYKEVFVFYCFGFVCFVFPCHHLTANTSLLQKAQTLKGLLQVKHVLLSMRY